MDPEALDGFLAEAHAWLAARQEELQTDYRLGAFESFWYDQEHGTLQLKDGDRVGLELPFKPIGSLNVEHGHYLWAWANSSVVEERRKDSLILRGLAKELGLDVFDRDEGFECDEVMAWQLAAICARHMGAIGVYRMPRDEGLLIWIALFPPAPS